MQPVRMHLSPNRKMFSQFFSAFPKSTSNFETKMSLRDYWFLKLYTAKVAVTWMTKTACVRTLMDSQHVKRSETLLKSAQQYFCHIFWSLWRKIRPIFSQFFSKFQKSSQNFEYFRKKISLRGYWRLKL